MKTGTVIQESTQTNFDASIVNVGTGRVMLLPSSIAEEVPLPMDAAVQIIVGDEIWLAEVLGRVLHGERRGIIAEIRYRLPKNNDEGRICRDEQQRGQFFCYTPPERCRGALIDVPRAPLHRRLLS